MALNFLSIVLIVCYALLFLQYVLHSSGYAVMSHNRRIEHGVLGVLLLLQAASVLLPLLDTAPLSLGIGRMLAIMAWIMLLIYWTCGFFQRVEGLQLFLLPLAALTLLIALLFPGQYVTHNIGSPAFLMHILVSLLAYTLFTLGAFMAILMLFLERSLHSRRPLFLTKQLPPLLSLETIMFRVISVGFVLLTLSVFSGIIFSDELFGKPFTFSHKNVFSVLSWLIFAALLSGRHFKGWRGKTAIRWTLTGFVLLLLAYVGSRVVLEFVLHRNA